MKPIRLLLVDDHEVLRIGLCKLFEGSRTVQVVGEAASAAEALRRADEFKPDVVLMDLRLPDMSGVEACRRIRSAHPKMRVLFLTSFQDRHALLSTTYAGASGYLLKQIAGKHILSAVETVAKGGSIIDPAMGDVIVQEMRVPPVPGEIKRNITLPSQQQRVLALIAEGMTNREIASALALSEKTVINYVRIIFQKLSFNRRSQAAAYFLRNNSLVE
jgi:DNA-binding NarL/FixJ family response regulator